MNNISQHTTTLTTFESLSSTLDTDTLIYQWFAKLIGLQQVKEELTNNDEVVQCYKALKFWIRIELALYLGIIASLIFYLIFLDYIYLLPGLLLYIMFSLLRSNLRKNVQLIGMQLLKINFESDEVKTLSLYQIGEKLSQKYNMRSLVFDVTSMSHIIQYTAFFIFIYGSCIYPFETLFTLGLILTGCFLVIAGKEFLFIYRGLI